MSVIVTDSGFGSDDWTGDIVPLAEASATANAVDLGSDADISDIEPLVSGLDLIRIDFPSFADGRGFTLARLLRLRGFKGRLRARGHVIADQYAMARRSGFDEVEIDDSLAARQPEDQWIFRSQWQSHDYQSRMRG